ncbi:MFS general substrate transporter [Cadophora sp. DSE1049]|nr:MFS general substrate transporter [Cadophora sp. DSE1049]
MTICVTFASSVFSTAAVPVAAIFGVSTEVFGPASEVYGRKKPLFIGYFCFAIFQIPIAVAQNLYTIIITRFFGGCFACAPLAIGGGLVADMFGPVDRGVGICVFCSATFIGPMIGPILGGFITQSHLGWRWTAWITLIMAATFGTLGFFTIPETSASRILQERAKRLRFEKKNWAVHSKADTVQIDVKTILTIYVTRPLQMLILEPILLLITIYMSLVYGILYLFFLAYPISFQRERGWNQGVGALHFLGIMIGIALGAFIIAYVPKTRYAKIIAKHGRVAPEERLLPVIFGSFLLPVGLFWFSWTSDPDISWVPQVIAGIPIGCGFLMIFLQGINYTIDVYLWLANSAISANTFLRSLAAAGFPMFATAMYNRLGVDWATRPILFYIYGEKIRKLSRYSPKI